MRVLLLTAIFLFSGPAMAQDEPVFCDVIAAHKSSSADYVPGVDVRGNDVVSADLEPAINSVLNPITIPVEVNIMERYGLTLPDGVELKPTIADIKIHQDGRIEYNGTDITQETNNLCSSIEITKPERRLMPPEPAQPKEQGKQAAEEVPKGSGQPVSAGVGSKSSYDNYGEEIQGEAE